LSHAGVIGDQFPHVQAADAELVDLDDAQTGTSDRQAADDQSAEAERANRDSSDCERSDGEATDALGLDRLGADRLSADCARADSSPTSPGLRPSARSACLREFVDAGELGGAAALAWRNREVVHMATVGYRDLASGLRVERDTVFRIASMSKPVTTVAALVLLDGGRFALDDPITIAAPELAHLPVLRDPEGPLDATDAAARSITFRDLLTHRSGLSYGEFHRGPIRHAYAEALGAQIDNTLTPDEWIQRLATLPLIDQPGGFPLQQLDGPSRLPDRAPGWRIVGAGACEARLRAARDARHRLRRSTRQTESPRGVDRLR